MVPWRMSRRTFLKGTSAVLIAAPMGAWGREEEPIPGSVAFPDDEELAPVLIRALARGGWYADVYIESRAVTRITMSSSEIRSLEYGVEQGGGVRTLHGEKTGYGFAETLDQEALIPIAEVAASIAAGPAGLPRGLGRVAVFSRVPMRDHLERAPIRDKVSLMERVDRAARAVDPAVQQVVVSYHDEVQHMLIATSTGQVLQDMLPMISIRATATASRSGRSAEGLQRASRRAGMELFDRETPEQIGREAALQAMRMLDAVPAPTGEMSVVVAAGGGVMFHEAIGHGLEADAVMRNASIFAGRMGQTVASKLVTIYDDATLEGERGSYNVDDEGTPAARTLLVDRGILTGYLHDRRSAHAMGSRSTGNGRRESFRFPPLVRMSNTFLASGDEDPADIVKRTDRGVYAAAFGGGEVDTASGQFTFGLIEAYLIENGVVTAPIRGATLVGSGIEVLERIDRVGADFGSWPGTCGKGNQSAPVTSACPTLRISRITVGGTA
ncbi:TldD/PmbA family protein [Candidatus Fermentibacteria bacterium]|nr:TldD/PmbA family protein [Candidatus Fermentibacteria bacterium]